MLLTTTDGTRLAATRTGRGTPVVLIHSSAGGLDSWDPIVPLLSDRFELWTYARRGYAPSDISTRPKTFADDVTDTRTVLAAAGGSAHVVGASYGATVALHAALTAAPANPGPATGSGPPMAVAAAIRSLVVFEPPLFSAGPSLGDALGRYRALLNTGDLLGASRVLAAEVARVPSPMLPAITALPESEAVGYLHDLEAMTADSADVGRWSGIDRPVLLLQGGETWAPMPATMDALAAALPSAARTVLPGQSHFATHTAPDLFAEALSRFLLEHE